MAGAETPFHTLQELGGSEFFQVTHGPPETRKNGNFARSPWAVGSTGKILRFGAETGGVSVAGNPLGPAAPSPVLPLEDLFDQPTVQSIGQLSDEPSLAALDALSADPTPILEALEEMAATNDRFLMLLVV